MLVTDALIQALYTVSVLASHSVCDGCIGAGTIHCVSVLACHSACDGCIGAGTIHCVSVLACHSACDGCTGAGTDNCNRCKPGYKLDDTNSCTGWSLTTKSSWYLPVIVPFLDVH